MQFIEELPQQLKEESQNFSTHIEYFVARLKSPATKKNYANHLNRYFYWLYVVKQKSIFQVTDDDLYDFFQFLKQPPQQYLGNKVSIQSKEWKPLFKPLSSSSVELSMYIMSSFYSKMLKRRVLDNNPCLLLDKSSITHIVSNEEIIDNNQSRYLNKHIFKMCIKAVDKLAMRNKDGGLAQKTFDRYRFIIVFFYLTMLRISEFAKLSTDNLVSTTSETGEVIWFFNVVGKGRVYRKVPISSLLAQHIEQYHQKSLFILSAEKNKPIIKSIRSDSFIEPGTLSKIIGKMFLEIADYIQLTFKDEASALQVKQASAHWLRHTGGSHLLAAGADVVQVRDLLGHASIVTTNTYLHTDSITDLSNTIEKLKI